MDMRYNSGKVVMNWMMKGLHYMCCDKDFIGEQKGLKQASDISIYYITF